MTSKAEIGEMLALASINYPMYSLPEGHRFGLMIEGYHRILGHIPAATLAAAFDMAVSRSEFMPTPAAVMRALRDLDEQANGSTEVEAMEQWGAIKKAMREYSADFPSGRGSNPGNEVTQRIVKWMGGMTALWRSDNEVADRARFLEAYRIECGRGTEARLMLPGVRRVLESITAHNHHELPAPSR